MNTYEYVALMNPDGASKMVRYYNLKPDRSVKGLAGQMSYCVSQDKDRAIRILADIHPDGDLFKPKIDEVKSKYESDLSDSKNIIKELFSNMSGQTIKSDLAHYQNIDGAKSNRSELLMIGGIILVSLALVLKK